jgi:hypothetical protein
MIIVWVAVLLGGLAERWHSKTDRYSGHHERSHGNFLYFGNAPVWVQWALAGGVQIFTFDYVSKYVLITALLNPFKRWRIMARSTPITHRRQTRARRYRPVVQQSQEPPETRVEKIKNSVWFLGAEIIVIIVTVAALVVSAYEFDQAGEDRIINFFNILVDPRSADVSRKRILAYLVSNGETLQNLDLSCAAMNNMKTRTENGETIEYCAKTLNLTGLDVSKATTSKTANLSRANLTGANLSGVIFTDVYLFSVSFTHAWAWINDPPIDLPADVREEITLCVFDNAIHDRNKRPDECITR